MPKSQQLDADLIIIGGSTAGLATAIFGQLSGLKCHVFEPRLNNFVKSCGEGLMPSAVALLDEMGVNIPESSPLSGIRYASGNQQTQAQFPTGTGLGIQREVLHAAMLQRATELGVTFETTKIKKFQDHGSSVSAGGMTARWLVGCDGLKSSVRKQIGIDHGRKYPVRFGLNQHYEAKQQNTYVEVYWSKDFEVYITPVGPHVVNVAVLFSVGRPFEEFIEVVPGIFDKIGQPLSSVMGAGPFEQRPLKLKHGSIFLVGDAAGFLDPITGEGNQLAMNAAKNLIHCIVSEKPGTYGKKWHQITRDYWYCTSLLLWFARGKLRRKTIVPMLKIFSGLFPFILKRIS